ncbi:MAG TPA: carbohydrate ABC transporter permease [Clostridiaceae bacterium]|nr:carbohydrate ABC transporter permease [Clostridiaceae bacterium]
MKKIRSAKRTQRLINGIVRIPMILYLTSIVVPFFFMLMNSFKSNREFYSNFWSIPQKLLIENYAKGLELSGILYLFKNTVYVVIFASIINIFFASMLSYSISRTGFKYSGALYKYLLIGMLTPGIICIIPVFFVVRVLGLYNTREALIIVYSAFNMSFSVFVMYSFFKTLPKDLEESAYIDGATYFQTFWKIMFPLAKPGIITIGIFGFLDYWNDYLLAMVLVVEEKLKTVSQGVMKMQAAQAVKTEWGPLFAVCMMAMLPVLLVYAFGQSKLTAGLTAGAVKG